MTTTGPIPSDDRPTDDDSTRDANDTATGPDHVSTEPGPPDVGETTADPHQGGHEQTTHRPSTEETAMSTGTADADPRRVRVGTVVWGLVIAVVGVGVLALASGYVFDVELAFIGLVTLAGVALLAGSLINGARSRGR